MQASLNGDYRSDANGSDTGRGDFQPRSKKVGRCMQYTSKIELNLLVITRFEQYYF